MDAMSMAVGPVMSTPWTRMPGQSWPGAASSFVAMWTVMMVAMMLPSLAPTLRRYRLAIGGAGTRRGVGFTTVVALGYFAVWCALGVVVFPLGVLLAEGTMSVPALTRAAPVVTGLVVLVAGLVQLTGWKARHLAFDRGTHASVIRVDLRSAWRHGLCLGMHCVYCCAGLTASLLVLGVMDVRVMTVVTVAITAERIAPMGVQVARVVGAIGIATGLFLVVR